MTLYAAETLTMKRKSIYKKAGKDNYENTFTAKNNRRRLKIEESKWLKSVKIVTWCKKNNINVLWNTSKEWIMSDWIKSILFKKRHATNIKWIIEYKYGHILKKKKLKKKTLKTETRIDKKLMVIW